MSEFEESDCEEVAVEDVEETVFSYSSAQEPAIKKRRVGR
jgi:hypothetical protein